MSRTGAKLGQHFLIHSWAARALAHAVPLREGERYLEIGPGKGILTRELLTLGPVVAVEKDPELVVRLRETFAEEIGTGKFRLLEGDVRDVVVEPEKTTPDASRGESDTRVVSRHTASVTLRLASGADGVVLSGEYVVAANIPYYITGEIIRQFLTAARQPRALALLVQKEVAQRVTSKKESILSLSVKAYGKAHIAEKVSKKHFSPPPKVDSAILVIEDVTKDFFNTISENDFFRVVHAGFASKRKFVSNNLAVVFGKEKTLAALALSGIPEKARAENIGVEQWKAITRALVG